MNFVPLHREVIYYTMLIGIVSDIANGHNDNRNFGPNILNRPKNEARIAHQPKNLKQPKYHLKKGNNQEEKEFVPYTYVIEVEHTYNDNTVPNNAGNLKRETGASGGLSAQQLLMPERSTMTPRLISEDINKKVEVFIEEGHDKSSYDHKEYDKYDEKWNNFDVHKRKVKEKVVDMERGIYPREKEYPINAYHPNYETTPLPIAHRRMPSYIPYESTNEAYIHKSNTDTGSSQNMHDSNQNYHKDEPKWTNHLTAQTSHSAKSSMNKILPMDAEMGLLTYYVPSKIQDSTTTETGYNQLPYDEPKPFAAPSKQSAPRTENFMPTAYSTYLNARQPTVYTRNHLVHINRNKHKPPFKNNKPRYYQQPKIMATSPHYFEVLVPFARQSSPQNYQYSKSIYNYKPPAIRNTFSNNQLTKHLRNNSSKHIKANEAVLYQNKDRRSHKKLPPYFKSKQFSLTPKLTSNSKKYKLISSTRPAKPRKYRSNRRRVPSLGYAVKEYWRLNTPSKTPRKRKIPKRNPHIQSIKSPPESPYHEKRYESYNNEDNSMKLKAFVRKNKPLSSHIHQNLISKHSKLTETRSSYLDSNNIKENSRLFSPQNPKTKHPITKAEGRPVKHPNETTKKPQKRKNKNEPARYYSPLASEAVMPSEQRLKVNAEDSNNDIHGNQGDKNSGFNMELLNRKPCWSSKPLTAEINFSNFKPTSGTPKWYTDENTTPGPLKGQVDVLREQFYEPLLKEALCL